jgi:flagellar biosynthesis component FlhA
MKSQRPILLSKRTIRPHLAAGLRMRHVPVFVASYEEVVTLTDVNIIGIV